MYRYVCAALLGGAVWGMAFARAEDASAVPTLSNDMAATWRFVHQALALNPEARAALERSEQAHATADAMAAPLYNPEIEGGFEQLKNDARKPSKIDLGISLTVDLGGKGSAKAKIGSADAQAAIADAQRIRLDVAHRLISGMAAHATSLEREKNALAQDQAARQFADIVERGFRAGDVGKPDVDVSRLSLLEAETERRASEAERLATELELQQLCSCELKELPSLPEVIPTPAQIGVQEMDRLLDQSLEFAVAQARVNAARGAVEFARSARVPDPTLHFGVGQDAGEQLYRVSLSIPIPVLNSGEAEVRAAGRGLAVSELDLEKVRRETGARVRSAHAAYVAAYANLQGWRLQGAKAVAARFDQLRRLLEARELTTTEYLVQQRETLSSASRGLEVERAAWAAFADWIAITNALPAAPEAPQ